MSDSESNQEFESVKDGDFDALKGAEESSEEEPLVKKGKKSPKKTKTSPKKSKSPKKTALKSKKNASAKNAKPKKNSKNLNVSFVEPEDPLADCGDSDNQSESEDEKEKGEEEYEVEAIVGHRDYNGKLMYKIRWKGYDSMHDTWEEYNALSCPDLLEMYNFKHGISLNSFHKKKNQKRKAAGKKAGRKKKPKKRRSSLTDEDEEEEDEEEFHSGDGDDGDGEEYEVQKIIDMRNKKDGTREFLVHWKRWSSDHDTWEPEDNLNCPDIIEKFLNQLETNKKTSAKELRIARKHTERFTLQTQEHGRRLSKRHTEKQRVKYFDADDDE